MYNYDLTDKCFSLNFLFACVFIFYLFIFLYFFSGFKKCNTEYPYSVYFEFSAFKNVTLRIYGVT